MWTEEQVSVEKLLHDYSIHDMYIGFMNNEAASVMILQEDDSFIWQDDHNTESLYLHKLCIRRTYAKRGISQQMIHWAKSHTKSLHKKSLRLDCAADRPHLCEFYAKHGFMKVKEILFRGKYPTALYEYQLVKFHSTCTEKPVSRRHGLLML